MDSLNQLLTGGAALFLAPFRNHPTTGLMVWSTVTGIIMAYVFGKTSNQRALRRAADSIRAQLFAVKLFKEDLVVTFQCQLQLLKSTGARLLHSIPPMLVMFVPLLFVLTQLAMRYEFRPLRKSEQTVVTMRVKPDAWREIRDVELSSTEDIVVETKSLRDQRSSTIHWRVRANGADTSLLQWKVGDQTISKELPMSASPTALRVANPMRPGNSMWDSILYPAEASLPSESPITSIEVELPPRETPILGWNVPWWATFFLVSMLVAFVAGKFMGVQY